MTVDGDEPRPAGGDQRGRVERVRLEHEQGVEQVPVAGQGLDVGQAEVLVREQPALGGLQVGHELGECPLRADRGPDRDGGDEQADHGVDAGQLRRPAGGRGAEDDVVAADGPREQHGVSRPQHGAQRQAPLAAERGEPVGQRRVDLTVEGRRWARLGGDAVPGARCQQGRAVETGELRPPRRARRVPVLGAQPAQVVLVGAGGRLVPRHRGGGVGTAAGAGTGTGVGVGVGQREQLAQQERQRPAVDDDVVGADRQPGAVRAGADPEETDERGRRQVEPRGPVVRDQPLRLGHPLGGGPAGQVDDGPLGFRVVQDRLGRCPAVGEDCGAQDGVPSGQGPGRRPQPVEVQLARQVQDELDHVHVWRVVAVDETVEQHPRLRRRQRPHRGQAGQPVAPAGQVRRVRGRQPREVRPGRRALPGRGSLPRGSRQLGRGRDVRRRGRHGGETGDGRGAEHVGQRDRHAGGGRPGDHGEGEDAVPAPVKERVVDAEVGLAEHGREDVPQDRLGAGGRRPAGLGGRREVGSGQGGAVQLPARVRGQRGQCHEGRRHHVARQERRRVRAEPVRQRLAVGRDGLAVDRDDVGHQRAPGRSVLPDDDRAARDRRVAFEHRLDLARFDPEAAHLDLVVGAAGHDQLARGPCRIASGDLGGPRGPVGEVAGAVHPLAGIEGARDEAGRGQRRPGEVAVGDEGAGDVQLSHGSGRHRHERAVQHVGPGVAQRPADRRQPAARAGVPPGPRRHPDRRLGRPVQVDDALRARGELPGKTRWHRLAAAQGAHPRVGLGGGVEDGPPPRRGRLGHRDLAGGQRPGQLGRVAGGLVVDEVDRGADGERREQLDRARVEGQGGRGQHPVVRSDAHGLGDGHQEVAERPVAERYALGPAGRAGRVDHVHQVVQADGRRPRSDDRRGLGAGFGVGLGVVDEHELQARPDRDPRGEGACGHHDRRSRVLDHERDPVSRIVGADREVGGPGTADAGQRDEQVDAARQRDTDDGAGPGPSAGEPAAERVGRGGELAVGQRPPGRDQRGPVGVAARPRVEQRHPRRGRAGSGGVVPGTQDLVAFGRAEQVGRSDRRVGLGHHAGQQPRKPRAYGAGERRRHSRRLVGRLQFERVGLAGVPAELGDDHQRELGGAVVQRAALAAQFVAIGVTAAQRGGGRRADAEHRAEQAGHAIGAVRVDGAHDVDQVDVRVRERAQARLAGPLQQVGEGVGRPHRQPEADGVAEVADHAVGRGVVPVDDGRSDGHVGRAGDPVDQGGVAGDQHHERRHAAQGSERPDPAGELRRRVVDDLPARVAPARAAPAGVAFAGGRLGEVAGRERVGRAVVGGRLGQAHGLGQRKQPVPPVGQALGPDGRLAGRHRRVDELDGVVRPGLLAAYGRVASASAVGGQQVAEEDVPGRVVPGDVVGGERQRVPQRPVPQDGDPQRRLDGQVERAPGGSQGDLPGTPVAVVGGLGGQVHAEPGRFDVVARNLLEPPVRRDLVRRAQDLVSAGDGQQCAAQRRHVERAGQFERGRDRVGGAAGVEPRQEPHPPLPRADRVAPAGYSPRPAVGTARRLARQPLGGQSAAEQLALALRGVGTCHDARPSGDAALGRRARTRCGW